MDGGFARGSAGASRRRTAGARAAASALALATALAAQAADRPVLGAPDLPAGPAAVPRGAEADPARGDAMRRDAARRASDPAHAPRGDTPPAPVDEETARAWRERGEREAEARRRRGALAPPPPATPRIGADPPPQVPPVTLPRIVVPGPGEPGGPPIALPTCGPAGCFDANGRPLQGSGGVLTTPDGRPCVRTGAAASCL